MNSKEHPLGAGFKFKWPRVLLKSADLFCPHSYLAHALKMPQEDLSQKTRLIFHLGHSFVSPNNNPSSAFYKIVRFAFKRFLASLFSTLLFIYLLSLQLSHNNSSGNANILVLACLRPQENLTCLSLPRRKITMRMPVKQTSSQMLKAIQPKQIGHCFFSVLIKKTLPTELRWHGKSKLISIWSLQAVLLSNYKF